MSLRLMLGIVMPGLCGVRFSLASAMPAGESKKETDYVISRNKKSHFEVRP